MVRLLSTTALEIDDSAAIAGLDIVEWQYP